MLKVYSIYTIYPPDLVRWNTILWIRIKLLMRLFSTQVDKTRERLTKNFHVELQIRKHFLQQKRFSGIQKTLKDKMLNRLSIESLFCKLKEIKYLQSLLNGRADITKINRKWTNLRKYICRNFPFVWICNQQKENLVKLTACFISLCTRKSPCICSSSR